MSLILLIFLKKQLHQNQNRKVNLSIKQETTPVKFQNSFSLNQKLINQIKKGVSIQENHNFYLVFMTIYLNLIIRIVRKSKL